MGIILDLQFWGAKKKWPKGLEPVGDLCRRADEALRGMADEVTRLRQALYEAGAQPMTHPPATCELCGDTGLYSPSALPCPKGCEQFDIVERLKFIGSMSLDQDAARLSYQAAEYVSNLLAALSEAERREKDARSKLQAMHRRAQASERVEQMVVKTMTIYDKGLNIGVRSHRILFRVVLRDLMKSAEKIRALKDEVR